MSRGLGDVYKRQVSDALKVGDMVDVKLLDVDFDKKRISLSMKALLNNDAE